MGSLSQFKATLSRRNERIEKKNNAFKNQDFSSKSAVTEFNFPELSHAEMEKLKSEIQYKYKQQRRKEIVIGIITVLLVSALILWILI